MSILSLLNRHCSHYSIMFVHALIRVGTEQARSFSDARRQPGIFRPAPLSRVVRNASKVATGEVIAHFVHASPSIDLSPALNAP